METMTRNRAKKRVLLGALGAGAGSLLCAPAANAQELPTLDNLLDGAIPDAGNITPNTPKPALPTAPVENIAHAIEGAVPSNLLRTNTGNLDAFEQPNVQVTPHAGTTPAPMAQNTVDKAINNYNDPAHQVQKIAQPFLDAMNGHNDPNTIGQAFGAWQLPNANTVDHINKDLSTLGNKISSGEIVNDIQSAIDQTINSPQYEAWRTNTDSILRVDGNLHGVDRAAAGISHLIDSVSTNPARAVADLTTAAGGPVNIVLNPINAAVRVATTVLGEDVVRDFTNTLKTIPGKIGESLVQALPALLTIPAGTLIGSLLGAPLGALPGAGIGGILGSSPLNPLNWLGALAGAIPGATLGALTTGLPGLIGSILLTLPALMLAPLAGSALGGAITAAIWATVVFGAYAVATLGLLIPVFIGAFMLSTAAFAVSMAITGFNPFMIPGAALISYWPVLLTPALFFVGWLAVTLWIPIVTYAVGLIPAYLLGAIPGGIIGSLAGMLIPLIGVPLLTALSALPGALIGGLLGALTGYGLSSLINGLIGVVLGGLTGALAGSVLGGLAGTALATPIALALATIIAGSSLLSFAEELNSDPNSIIGKLRRSFDQGWRHSKLGQLIGTLERNFYRNTETGRAWGDLLNRINNLWHTMAFLDGRRLRNMLMRGGLLGALIGAPLGAVPGGILGALAGLFNPLNLVNGLMGALIGANIGTPLGAVLGALTSLIPGVLAALGSIPLTFLPNLLAAFAGWTALNLPALLASFAATLLPPFVIAASVASLVWFPIWVLFGGPLIFAVAVAASIVTLAVNNPLFLLVALPIAAIVGPLSGAIAIGAATLNTILGFGIMFFVAAFVGVPVFWLTLPFFLFPAVAATGLWALGLPSLLPIALGMSILESIGIGAAVTALANLINIPLGALLGGLAGATIGNIAGTLVAALTRALTYGAAGAVLGSLIGAINGGILGAIAALVTHLRANAGSEPDGTQWVDGRIVDRGGFGDLLADLPGIGADSPREPSRMAVPNVGMPRIDGSSIGDNYALSDNTALLGV